MRAHTYTRQVPGLADAVNLQALLDRLGEYLLGSGFDAPWEGRRDLEALRQALIQALAESGQLTPDLLRYLRGERTGDEAKDRELEARLAELLDGVIGRLTEEGWLELREPHDQLGGPLVGPTGAARRAAQDVHFGLTEKARDFLGYRALRELLGAIGRSSAGSHETTQLATGIEAEAAPRPYEFGDTLNLDVPATLGRAIARAGVRMPLPLEYGDLMVHQAEYRSSAATVLLLDCSHSMILYGEDRFTPAKKVALALTHLIRTQFPGDSLRVVLFHDGASEIPLSALAEARVGPYHTNTAEGLRLARRILAGQKKDMKQVVMITDGKPSALTLPGGQVYINSAGLDPRILQATFREVHACRQAGIQINTFMLARDPSLVAFVRQVARICRGKAYFTSPMTLGQFILMDFLRGKSRRVG